MCELYRLHTPAFLYDFRHLFMLSLRDFGHTVSWGEIVALIQELLKSDTSHLRASLAGDKHHITYSDEVLIGLIAGLGGIKEKEIKKLIGRGRGVGSRVSREQKKVDSAILEKWFNS